MFILAGDGIFHMLNFYKKLIAKLKRKDVKNEKSNCMGACVPVCVWLDAKGNGESCFKQYDLFCAEGAAGAVYGQS